MAEFTTKELDLMSRALERALAALPGKPRPDVSTMDLAEVIIREATEALRCESEVAKRAVAHVLRGKIQASRERSKQALLCP